MKLSEIKPENPLETQFLNDLIECSECDNDVEIEGMIEDIWDAPNAWPEYRDLLNQDDPDEVREKLITIAKKWGYEKEYILTIKDY